MITKFNAGNISPFCEGFLNNIYDGAQRMIEDRLNHPEHGEMDARFVKEAVESSWAAEMSSQYAPLLLSMLQSGQIPAEQVENFHLAKKRIMSSLFGFIRTNELAPVVQVVNGVPLRKLGATRSFTMSIPQSVSRFTPARSGVGIQVRVHASEIPRSGDQGIPERAEHFGSSRKSVERGLDF